TSGPLLWAAVRGTHPAFDGRPVTARLALVTTSVGAVASPAGEITVRLTGDIPPGARTFTFANDVHLGSWMLVLRSEGDETPARQWLENDATSRAHVL